jgi:hypothetical protein
MLHFVMIKNFGYVIWNVFVKMAPSVKYDFVVVTAVVCRNYIFSPNDCHPPTNLIVSFIL